MTRTPMRKISSKQRAKQKAWAIVVRRRMEEMNGTCEGAIPGICTGRATDGHHLKTRARGGTNDYENVCVLCAACHRHVHANPIWSAAFGYLL